MQKRPIILRSLLIVATSYSIEYIKRARESASVCVRVRVCVCVCVYSDCVCSQTLSLKMTVKLTSEDFGQVACKVLAMLENEAYYGTSEHLDVAYEQVTTV